MSYTNLIDLITDAEKETMINYIDSFGVLKEEFIGLDKWLEPWSHANQQLFKILGNKLIREFNFKYNKTEENLSSEFRDALYFSGFKNSYHDFYLGYIVPKYKSGEFTEDNKDFFNHLLDIRNFVDDKIYYGIKYKAPTAKKMLQIQAGAKPLRAITRVMEYFKNEYEFKFFDDFRVKHSLVMNDKTINGKVCLSIHPLDFMTMSDNASNWSSCMSWEKDGCYRVGTIEMMNSNNVICAYLKNDSTPFKFCNLNTGEVMGEWNNKKWRQLFYVNKNIIMSGKAYPYIQEDITRFVLDTLKNLTKENCNWEYAFGIERYEDMINVNSLGKMKYQRMKMHAKTKDKVKHNIIWDTRGMYNDMLNDNTYPYLCYRNKVDNTKIYSASGKCPCLRCGESIIDYDPDEEYYNDRYSNTGSVLCRSCYDEFPSCQCCDCYSPIMNVKIFGTFYNNDWDVRLCPNCIEKYVRLCPCCGKPIYIRQGSYTRIGYSPYVFEEFKGKTIEFIEDRFYTLTPSNCTKERMDKDLKADHDYLEEISLCVDCQRELKENSKALVETGDIIDLLTTSRWGSDRHYYILNPEKYKSYRYYNLKKPEGEIEKLALTYI